MILLYDQVDCVESHSNNQSINHGMNERPKAFDKVASSIVAPATIMEKTQKGEGGKFKTIIVRRVDSNTTILATVIEGC